jgi:UDP:flavonoid glycosyltransferase YjiC (YdhE family)
LRVEALRQTVFELLENPTYRNAAKEVQSSLINAGGNDRAVELLENFVKQSTLIPV